MKSHFPSIHTPHLALRPLQPGDADALYHIYQSEGVLQYFPNPIPPPLGAVRQFIARQEVHWEEHGYGNWAVLINGKREVIGWAGLQYLSELDETEVGFLLDRPFWGKGFATEIALASLRFGFEHFGLDHIIALVHPDNLASRRVIEKCGMTCTETILLWGIQLMRYQVSRPSQL